MKRRLRSAAAALLASIIRRAAPALAAWALRQQYVLLQQCGQLRGACAPLLRVSHRFLLRAHNVRLQR